MDNRQLIKYIPDMDGSKLPAFPPIRSQGSFSSCGPFSATCYQLTHMVGLEEGRNNKNNDNSIKFSPKWTSDFFSKGEDSGRQANGNGATGTVVVRRSYSAAHQVDEFFYQGQTDSRAAGGAGKGVIHTIKVVEDFF